MGRAKIVGERTGRVTHSQPALVLIFVAVLLIATAIWGAGASRAAVTLGSDLATEPTGQTACSFFDDPRGCLVVNDVLPGQALVAPAAGGIVRWTIGRWNLRVGAPTQAGTVRVRVVRRVPPDRFTVISSGPLEQIPAGAGLYSFPAQLSISAGDEIAVDQESGQSVFWRATAPGARGLGFNPSPPDGGTTDPPAFSLNNEEFTFNAVLDPANTFTLGSLRRNRKKGTARIDVTVPNPGEITGLGKGAKVAGARAVTSKSVTGPGTVTLAVKAKGKKKRKLNETGKVKLNLGITYTPTGGDPRTQPLKLKLRKKL